MDSQTTVEVQVKAMPASEREHECDWCGRETRQLRVTDRDGWWVCKDGCEGASHE